MSSVVMQNPDVLGGEPVFAGTRVPPRASSITDLLLGHYSKDCSTCVRITFPPLDGKQVCLFIRSGNSTLRLSTREALEYCKTRWKGPP
jgi:hypothetical protein